jgi:hypothetical protein
MQRLAAASLVAAATVAMAAAAPIHGSSRHPTSIRVHSLRLAGGDGPARRSPNDSAPT